MIKKNDYMRLISLISDYTADKDDQKTLVNAAFFGYPGLSKRIVFGTSAQDFAVHVVEKCLEYGDLEPGEPALVSLLEHIRDVIGVGLDKKPTIDDLIAKISQHVRPPPPPLQVRTLITTATSTDKPTNYPDYDQQALRKKLVSYHYKLQLEKQVNQTRLFTLFRETRRYNRAYHVWHHAGVADENGIYVVRGGNTARLLKYEDLAKNVEVTPPASIALLHLESHNAYTPLWEQLQNIGFGVLICCTSNGQGYQQFVSTFYRQLTTGNIQMALQDAMQAFKEANTTESLPQYWL